MRSLRMKIDDITRVDSILNLADHLQLSDRIVVQYAPDVKTLCDTLRAASPVHAQLSVSVGSEPMHFWDIAELAPRLRYLDLTVSVSGHSGSYFNEDYASWVVRPSPHRLNAYHAHMHSHFDRTTFLILCVRSHSSTCGCASPPRHTVLSCMAPMAT